ncbi:DUF2062 domain-containing protein [Granulicella sp. 5B5]|uniref:DUF2062 domain-containing protein n=1 Tax=Granulicella sp. 5B5 TaxID=1617967 RepID=UPI0015F6724D|nr:DUF2062 domain-containing protein [Granulicella sp. 5B5]QMV18027.1 DUF2062 domain-containing protein [Granulicella sp. 5B5]
MGKLLERVVVEPLLRLMRMGATPERLAWSLALGVVVGVNPLFGSTTLLVLGLAAAFRLNLVASQLGNHMMYPLEIALFPLFLKLGSLVFATERPPMEGHHLLAAVRHHPWDTTRALWLWEWHALVVWVVCAAVTMPLVALALRPLLRRMMHKAELETV